MVLEGLLLIHLLPIPRRLPGGYLTLQLLLLHLLLFRFQRLFPFLLLKLKLGRCRRRGSSGHRCSTLAYATYVWEDLPYDVAYLSTFAVRLTFLHRRLVLPLLLWNPRFTLRTSTALQRSPHELPLAGDVLDVQFALLTGNLRLRRGVFRLRFSAGHGMPAGAVEMLYQDTHDDCGSVCVW